MALIAATDAEALSCPRSVDLVVAGQDGFNGGNDGGIELRFDRLRHPKSRDAAGHRLSVGAVARHGVVRVSDRDDPGEERDVIPNQAFWLPVTVNPFVMVPNDFRYVCVVFDLSKNALADR